MKKRPLPWPACLAVTSLLIGAPTLPAGAAVDPLAAEAAVRKADADWAAAASSHSADAWMSFYASDAIVLLPDDQLASGREIIRETVTHLLERPHFSVASRPIEVQVARSGDLASLVGAYELRFESRGALESSRGRRLEIWRRQADGSWKCMVDSWTLDQPSGAPAAAAPTSVPTLSPASQPAAPTEPAAMGAAALPPIASPQPPISAPQPPSPSPDSGPPAPTREPATPYGDMPTYYEQSIRRYFAEHLKHPEHVQYGEITRPEHGSITKLAGGLLMTEKRIYGWSVQAAINAQDAAGKYVGFRTYSFLFRGEKIIDAHTRLAGEGAK